MSTMEYAKLKFNEEPFMTKLRIGTDCSGIEAPIQALRQIGVAFTHVFSAEVDKFCKQSIQANYNPMIEFDDIMERKTSDIPNIDLYVCGFPCQPFSNAGTRKGFNVRKGNVFFSCIDVINAKKPKYFILENVRGLIWHDKGKTWATIWDHLQNLKDYDVYHKVLNTKDYGIPQNRDRVYMVGVLKSLGQVFTFPDPIPLEKHITDYIDKTIQEIRPNVIKAGMLKKLPENAVFVDFSFKKHNYPNSGVYAPCIAADSRTWCIPMHRYANCRERLALQGFGDFIQVVSNSQMKKQIGNSMSVNVLVAILNKILL